MATIYRVQNKKGYGPYYDWPDFGNPEINDELHSHSRHENKHKWPNRINDPGLKYQYSADGILFGFASMAQLIRWFRPGLLDELLKAGFNVVCIEGEILAQSKKQVIFRKETELLPVNL